MWFNKLKEKMVDVYGVHTNEDDEDNFFECPDCTEPIYLDDWKRTDIINRNGVCSCPVCESPWDVEI